MIDIFLTKLKYPNPMKIDLSTGILSFDNKKLLPLLEESAGIIKLK